MCSLKFVFFSFISLNEVFHCSTFYFLGSMVQIAINSVELINDVIHVLLWKTLFLFFYDLNF